LENKAPVINGDGSHSRDFTFVANAVDANVAALFTTNKAAVNQVYNIACGEQTSLLQLFEAIREEAKSQLSPQHGPERAGDVKHSLADISKAKELLGYQAAVTVDKGLRTTFAWYKNNPDRL
jgi:UDP-glucose 4-epimerase